MARLVYVHLLPALLCVGRFVLQLCLNVLLKTKTEEQIARHFEAAGAMNDVRECLLLVLESFVRPCLNDPLYRDDLQETFIDKAVHALKTAPPANPNSRKRKHRKEMQGPEEEEEKEEEGVASDLDHYER
eukprot:GHVT01087562.1.p3 GENE.GHVT01087562.1~~GHVT01087562.1.p3  ORF type:complete len:130 (+),score=30.35 GHVT01087562.1:283-672(+)